MHDTCHTYFPPRLPHMLLSSTQGYDARDWSGNVRNPRDNMEDALVNSVRADCGTTSGVLQRGLRGELRDNNELVFFRR